jgi:hypothetical protein
MSDKLRAVKPGDIVIVGWPDNAIEDEADDMIYVDLVIALNVNDQKKNLILTRQGELVFTSAYTTVQVLGGHVLLKDFINE